MILAKYLNDLNQKCAAKSIKVDRNYFGRLKKSEMTEYILLIALAN
jgi:glutamine amidotransferase PdxT